MRSREAQFSVTTQSGEAIPLTRAFLTWPRHVAPVPPPRFFAERERVASWSDGRKKLGERAGARGRFSLLLLVKAHPA